MMPYREWERRKKRQDAMIQVLEWLLSAGFALLNKQNLVVS